MDDESVCLKIVSQVRRTISLSMFENIKSYELMLLSYPVSHCVQTAPHQCQNEICPLFCIWLLSLCGAAFDYV